MATIDAARVQALVHRELASYNPPDPAPGTTVGVPWAAARSNADVAELKAALVTPYLQRFVLKDTWQQMTASPPILVDCWVIAIADSFLLFYDPDDGDFGLACQPSNGELPDTIGVRGDLVGTFGAR